MGVIVGTAYGPVDFVIIDDPIGAREDAGSQRVRDKNWDWYKADVSPRMKPVGRQILIQSRWHEDMRQTGADSVLVDCSSSMRPSRAGATARLSERMACPSRRFARKLRRNVGAALPNAQ